MSNPIIEYGIKRDAEKKRAEDALREKKMDELRQLKATVLSEFEDVFKSIIPDIKASQVTFSVEFETNRFPSRGNALIKFEHTPTRGICKIEFASKSHYRYCHDIESGCQMQFGEWPIDELLGFLYDRFFKELPF